MTLSYEEFVNAMIGRVRVDTHLVRMMRTFDWSTDDYEECLYFDLIYTVNVYNEDNPHTILSIYERMINDVINIGYGHILDRLVTNRDRLFKFWYIKVLMPKA
jgi:hypothetical protein